MTIKIRQETLADYRRVEELAREAFWNLYFPGCHEHFVIHRLRSHTDFIPELTFVLEVDGVVQGAIFYSRSSITAPDGVQYPTITFGPVFIAPQLHRQGLGRALITHSIQKAKEQGHRAILTLGYPYHYEPYGFCGGKRYGISMPDLQYYKGLLVLPLFAGALDGISGYVRFSEVLEEVPEQEAEDFDAGFPKKEKAFQPSQLEYEQAAAQLDV